MTVATPLTSTRRDWRRGGERSSLARTRTDDGRSSLESAVVVEQTATRTLCMNSQNQMDGVALYINLCFKEIRAPVTFSKNFNKCDAVSIFLVLTVAGVFSLLVGCRHVCNL